MEFRVREARTQGANVHALRLQLTVHALGQRDEICLRRTVAVIAGTNHPTRNGGNVDDSAKAPLAHRRREQVAHVRHGGEHQFEKVCVLRETRLLQQIRSGRACIVHQPVDLPSGRFDLFENAARRFTLAQIRFQTENLNAMANAQGLRNLLEARSPTRHEHKVHAKGGKLTGELGTNAGGRAGYQGAATIFGHAHSSTGDGEGCVDAAHATRTPKRVQVPPSCARAGSPRRPACPSFPSSGRSWTETPRASRPRAEYCRRSGQSRPR